MRVIWASSAEKDRIHIFEFISLDNPIAAIAMDELFTEVASRLEKHPLLGKPGRIAGTRELIPHANYRLIYEVLDDQLKILALVHTSRLWPN
jgi:addiction module RelE/StbE family toxin